MGLLEKWNTRPIPTQESIAKAVAAMPAPFEETPAEVLAPLISLYYDEEVRRAKARVRDHRLAGRPAHSSGFNFFGPARAAF